MFNVEEIIRGIADRLKGPAETMHETMRENVDNTASSADSLERIADCLTVLTIHALPHPPDGELHPVTAQAMRACLDRIIEGANPSDE